MGPLQDIIKYPRTSYLPSSPSISQENNMGPLVFHSPSRFIGEEIVITEKLDGLNVMLQRGEVYARSVASGPAKPQPWLAMVKKHHAWKFAPPAPTHIAIYGEDIYGVHSIKYGPVPENQTFYAFASARRPGVFASFQETERLASANAIPMVPVLFRGKFQSLRELEDFLRHEHSSPSRLGGEREGMVIRLAGEFTFAEFDRCATKSVRKDHVQTDQHWTRRWKPCATLPPETDHTAG